MIISDLKLTEDGRHTRVEARVTEVRQALAETRHYVECVRSSPDQGWTYDRHLSAMHVIDHLDRLADRCAEAERWATVKEDPELDVITRELAPTVNGARTALVRGERPVDDEGLEAAWQSLQDECRAYRERVLNRVAAGEFEAVEGIERLDAVRGARRVAYHAWRIAYHLNRCRAHDAPAEGPEDTAVPPHAEAEPPEPD